jgi:ankyrin repeat protein
MKELIINRKIPYYFIIEEDLCFSHLQEAIENNEVDIDAIVGNQTALMLAIQLRKKKTIDLLISYGANLNIMNENIFSRAAIDTRDIEYLKYLLGFNFDTSILQDILDKFNHIKKYKPLDDFRLEAEKYIQNVLRIRKINNITL